MHSRNLAKQQSVRQQERNAMKSLATSQSNSFVITKEASGSQLYQWVNRDFSMYSSRKLWDISRELSGADVDSDALLNDINCVLLSRNASSPWHAPH